MLAIVETHPVQYHAPVYRAVQQQFGVPVTVIYGSDFSVAGYRDAEFGASFAWDTDLMSGYSSQFLSTVNTGGATSAETVTTAGMGRALRALRPEAAMVVGYSPRFHQVAWFEARRTARRLLFRAETSDDTRTRGSVRAGLRRSALRAAYKTCDRVLYIGSRSHEHFRRLGVSESRLVFSPYCVDASAFEPDEAARTRLRDGAREALGVRPDERLILFSGKLSRRKGVDLLIPAIRVARARFSATPVVAFLGSGERRAALEADAGVAPTVRCLFPGFKNQTEMSPFYHAADCLVLPSIEGETWGLVVNEALHHGVPCVVSDRVGCAPDLVRPGTTGVICSSGSVDALAQGLADIQTLWGRSDIRTTCRDAVAGYSVERAAAGIAAAYQAALAA